ncbi:MAG: DUF4845 domain-containing protein [Methylococcaceae bacterium]|nr:DUF4845 domain-containing protein [Methylococcaceae bacterium]
MELIKKQVGLSYVAVLMIVGALAITGFFATRVGLVYFNHYQVKSIFDLLESEQPVAQRSTVEIRRFIAKYFSLNSIDYIQREDIKLEQKVGSIKVQLDYEVVKPISGNLSFLISFSETKNLKVIF